jgi:hypothetical protein
MEGVVNKIMLHANHLGGVPDSLPPLVLEVTNVEIKRMDGDRVFSHESGVSDLRIRATVTSMPRFMYPEEPRPVKQKTPLDQMWLDLNVNTRATLGVMGDYYDEVENEPKTAQALRWLSFHDKRPRRNKDKYYLWMREQRHVKDTDDVASTVPNWLWEHDRISRPRLENPHLRLPVQYGDMRSAYEAIVAAFLANYGMMPKATSPFIHGTPP